MPTPLRKVLVSGIRYFRGFSQDIISRENSGNHFRNQEIGYLEVQVVLGYKSMEITSLEDHLSRCMS